MEQPMIDRCLKRIMIALGLVSVQVVPSHVKLSKDDFKTLFGDQATWTSRQNFRFNESFLTKHKVLILGQAGEKIPDVEIHGPFIEKSTAYLSPYHGRVIAGFKEVPFDGVIKLIGPKGTQVATRRLFSIERRAYLPTHCGEKMKTRKHFVQVEAPPTLVFDRVPVSFSEDQWPLFLIDEASADAGGLSTGDLLSWQPTARDQDV